MKRKPIILLLWALALCAETMAVPAKKEGIVVQDADGKDIMVYLHGDEHFHWMTNQAGEWLAKDSNGRYVVVDPLPSDSVRRLRAASRHRLPAKAASLSVAAPPRGLVILVSFADTAFRTPKTEIDSMLNGIHYTRSYSYTYLHQRVTINSEGSARQYFADQSAGQYVPEFDVVGPVTVSREMAYYGKKSMWGTNDANSYKMVEEACKLADQQGADFSRYDSDNDGYVDFVYVLYAGFGEADSGIENTIWPHSSWLTYYGRLTLDGKIVDKFACSNELTYVSKQHDGIGSFCHEFSHILGLPDLYCTDDEGDWKTLGKWDIMDSGSYNNDSNTPAGYSAYERFFLGWTQPRVLRDAENVRLQSLDQSNETLLVTATGKHNLKGDNPNPQTFFMIENRQQTGWDEYLPGHGMLITKIQYEDYKWASNTVNNTEDEMGVDLIEADGKAPKRSSIGNSYLGKRKDAFPAGADSYNTAPFNIYSVSDVTENEGTIFFRFKGGVETGLAETGADEPIVAIYDILGRPAKSLSPAELDRGIYIVRTRQRTYTLRK